MNPSHNQKFVKKHYFALSLVKQTLDQKPILDLDNPQNAMSKMAKLPKN